MDEVGHVMDFPDLLKFISGTSLKVLKKKVIGCRHWKIREITEYL